MRTLKVVLTICWVATTCAIQAQDIVRLTDNTKIKGKIIRYDQTGVTMVRLTGDTLVIGRAISRIDFDAINPWSPGLYFSFSAGFHVDGQHPNESYDSKGVSFTVGTGYDIRHFLSVGFVAGFENFGVMNAAPVAIELSGRILDRNVTPYYNLQLGGAAGLVKDPPETWMPEYDDVKGGFRMYPSLGMIIQSKDISTFLLLGFVSQRAETLITDTDWQGNPTSLLEERTFRRMVFRMGFLF